MKTKKLVAFTLVLIAVISIIVSGEETNAVYNNYDLFTELSADPMVAVQLMEEYEGAHQQSNIAEKTVGELIKYFIYESEYAPFYQQGKNKKFPDNEMTYFSDSLYGASFSGARQCMAFSNYVSAVIYGGNGPRLYPQSNSVSDLKDFFLRFAQPGEHIRWSFQHSANFVAANDDGIYYLHRIAGGEIKLSFYSFVDMSSLLMKNNLELFIYNSVSTENIKIEPLAYDEIQMVITDGILHVDTIEPIFFKMYVGTTKQNMRQIQPENFVSGSLNGFTYNLKEHFGLFALPNSTIYCKIAYQRYGHEWESEIYEVKYHISEEKTENQTKESNTSVLPTVVPEIKLPELIQKPNETKKVNEKSNDEQINNNAASVDEIVIDETEVSIEMPGETQMGNYVAEEMVEIPEDDTKSEEPQKLYRWRTVNTINEKKISDVPVADADWILVDTQSETNYSPWSDWTETEIQPSNVVEVETRQEQQEIVVSSKKQFNYSYYTYQHNGQKYYTWSEEYAKAMGGGEKVERGWSEKELFLFTLYDGAVYGTDFVDNGIWFNEQVREVPVTEIQTKTFYRSREKNITKHYIYKVTKTETSAWSDWSSTIPVGGPEIEIEERIVSSDKSYI